MTDKGIIRNEEEMAILNQTIPVDPKEGEKFSLTSGVKPAHLEVECGLEDDSHLPLGSCWHGYRNVDLIESDDDLELTDKSEANETDSDLNMKSKIDYKKYMKSPRFQWKSQKNLTYPVEGFTNTEVRRFLESYMKFGIPLEHLKSIARDAKLVDKSVTDLKYLGELLHNSCASAINKYAEKLQEKSEAELKDLVESFENIYTSDKKEYEEQLDDDAREDKGLGKKKGTSIKLFDVKVKAKDITPNEGEMAILNQTISADPVEKAKFCLTCRVKAALYDVDRGLKDDSHLFLGTDKPDNRKLELMTSDHDLKLTDKILPVETDKTPQEKHLQAQLNYLLDLVKKKKQGNESLKEKISQKDGQGKSLEKTEQKKKKKEKKEVIAISAEKKDEKETENTKDKTEKAKDSEAKVGDQGNPPQGPVFVTAESEPIAIAKQEEELLDQETFDICKEKMQPVRKAIQDLGNPGKGRSVEELDNLMQSCILKIGDHIRECLKAYPKKQKTILWRRNLWVFVSKLVEVDAMSLYRFYKKARMKRTKDEEEGKQKEELVPFQSEPSGTSQDSVVPQIPHGPPQKVHQPPPSSPQMHGYQRRKSDHSNERYFSRAERGRWQRDHKSSYGGDTNHV